MIKCITIDDEQASLNLLRRYIEAIPELTLVAETLNPLEGITLVMQHKPQVVFLDIHMKLMNGMEVAKIINSVSKVIFCTAYPEFAVESYELDAVDYLQKPVDFSRFEFSIKKLAAQLSIPFVSNESHKKGYTFVKTERGIMIKVDYEDIDFVKSAGNYIELHCGNKKILAYHTLKYIENYLPSELFSRVHRCYIVQLEKIARIVGREIQLTTSKEYIPISDQYREAFLITIRLNEQTDLR